MQAIPGVVPSLVGDVEGCAFRNRCPQAQPTCERTPPLMSLPGDHRARCHYADRPVPAPRQPETMS
nr:oligopeptide/dipeptide ABC transporter ATP-binding protein [Salinicola acroporae]